MTKYTESRVKYLRIALQEAHRAGDEAAVKRLTAKLVKIIGGRGEASAQARVG
jgi:hypothetical protein